MSGNHAHFADQSAAEHVLHKRAQGTIAGVEMHGAEAPGHLMAGADAMRDTGVVLLLLWIVLSVIGVPLLAMTLVLGVVGLGWLVWKTGRSAWLGWARLERLHRLIEQEKWEIEHHRAQEREELTALYRLKGFEGELLEQVVDVLMADGDRLLRVMLEEELGLTLQSHEHPLKQALGALLGSLIALTICQVGLYLSPSVGLPLGAALTIIGATSSLVKREGNRLLPALVWTAALVTLAAAVGYFSLAFLLRNFGVFT